MLERKNRTSFRKWVEKAKKRARENVSQITETTYREELTIAKDKYLHLVAQILEFSTIKHYLYNESRNDHSRVYEEYLMIDDGEKGKGLLQNPRIISHARKGNL